MPYVGKLLGTNSWAKLVTDLSQLLSILTLSKAYHLSKIKYAVLDFLIIPHLAVATELEQKSMVPVLYEKGNIFFIVL